MKNLGTLVAAVVVAAVLLAYMCTFQVRFTEVAIVKTWGKPVEPAITEPGLRFKWPSPVQSVVVYDKRLRVLEDRHEETRTADGKNVLLTTFTIWRISDPFKFHTNFPDGVVDGERKLRTAIGSGKQDVIGKHFFDEFVSTDPARRKLREIEHEMKATVDAVARTELGIEIVDFGIKKLGLPKAITTEIFNSMKEAEQTKAAGYIEEGNAEAQGIVASARATEGRIMAAARERVAGIHAEAQQLVSEYYKEFDKHPELRMFLDKLNTNAEALSQRTTLILDFQDTPWDVWDAAARSRMTDERERAGADLAEPQAVATTSEHNGNSD